MNVKLVIQFPQPKHTSPNGFANSQSSRAADRKEPAKKDKIK